MTHWWNPKTLLRMKELERLEKMARSLQADDLPVPGSLKMKIAELRQKLSEG